MSCLILKATSDSVRVWIKTIVDFLACRKILIESHEFFLLPVLTVLLLFSLINLDVEVRKLAAFLLSSLSVYHIGKFQAGGQLAGDSAV